MQRWLYKTLISLILLLVPLFANAWNSSGHMIIAQIAYDNLSTATKRLVNQYISIFHQSHPRYRYFIAASHYADDIRSKGNHQYDTWHFINLPFSPQGLPAPKEKKQNLVWGINQCEQQLKNPQTSKQQKAFYLVMLLHLVGDAHQPMHCISRITKRFPFGDRGGNLYPIKYAKKKNLHAFWDAAGGYFRQRFHNQPLRYWQVRILAREIQARYPKAYFGNKLDDLHATDWVQSSFKIAKVFAYSTPKWRKPSRKYIMETRNISQQQIALAGYRLANWLNRNLTKV
ncbi:MAG: S1/P1 nuclease [Pseudomonadota bacterium]